MKRAIIIPTIVISVFAFYIYYGLSASFSNKNRLDKIESIYFPTLEKIDATIVNINMIESLLLQFVTTGDEILLDDATQHRDQVNSLLVQIKQSQQAYKEDTNRIVDQFNQYINLGIKASSALHLHQFNPQTDDNFNDIHNHILEMNQKLISLRSNVNSFRKRIYISFTLTLKTAKNEAKKDFNNDIIRTGIILVSTLILMHFSLRYFSLPSSIRRKVKNFLFLNEAQQ